MRRRELTSSCERRAGLAASGFSPEAHKLPTIGFLGPSTAAIATNALLHSSSGL